VPAINTSDSEGSDVVTPHELADILALSERDLITLSTAGVLVRGAAMINRRQRVVYALRDNVRRYVVHMRQPREEARDSYAEERRATQAIVRQQKELELAIARGDMIRRSRVVLVMTALLGTIKNHMLAVPSRLTRQLLGQRDAGKVRRMLDAACRDCLRETAGFGAHSFDETSKNGTQNGSDERLRQRVKRRRRKS
jgi:phage terminase Nu1 subunit (DNA packaging protein)